MSSFCYTNPDPINIIINIQQNIQLTYANPDAPVESVYDYVLDVDMSKSFISNGNWIIGSQSLGDVLIQSQNPVLSHGIKMNDIGNVIVVSRDNGTILFSNDMGVTFTNMTIDANGNQLSRAAIGNGRYPGSIVLATRTRIYTSFDIAQTFNSFTMAQAFPIGSTPYCAVTSNSQYMAVYYSYVGADMTDSSLMSTYFLLSLDVGKTWNTINLNYRQILLSWSTNTLYYLSYGASPTLYSLDLTQINLSNIVWTTVRQFTTPSTGYCPIINMSTDAKYISELHVDSGNTIMNHSSNNGVTWTTTTIPYLINNSYNYDISTMSLSGKIQSFWINDATGQAFLVYSVNYGQSWAVVNIYNQSTTGYGVYDISDSGSYILLYQAALCGIIQVKLSLVLNDMFKTFTYIQNPTNSNQISVTIQPDVNTFRNIFSNYTGIYSLNSSVLNYNSVYTSLNQAPGIIGQKLLEVLATKIFGNPATTAAIINDKDYNTTNGTLSRVSGNIMNGIVNVLYTEGANLFNQYAGSSIYMTDGYGIAPGYGDSANPFSFNLTDAAISVPLNLIGNLTTADGMAGKGTNNALSLIYNGVNTGGTTIVNGVYNIPFLLKFHYN